MIPIARRGSTVAWADEPFDPAIDDVELRAEGLAPVRVRWQSALKHGYWVPVDDDQDE